MNRKMLRVLIALLTMTTLTISGVTLRVQAEETTSSEKMNNEAISVTSYQKIISSFSDPDDFRTYPSYYAGAYLNDMGNLVILVTVETPSVKNAVLESAGNNNIIFEKANYSYYQLSSLQSQIYIKYQETNKPYLITEIYIDDQNNQLIVAFDKLSTAAEKWFNDEICSSKAIKLVEYNKPIENKINIISKTNTRIANILTTSISLKLGQEIRNPSKGSSARISVGFRAVRNSINGFVTCAHAVSAQGLYNDVGDTITNSSGTTLGTVQQSLPSKDCCFVGLTNSSDSISNKIYGTSIAITSYLAPPQNSTVYFRGWTQSVASGTVTSTSAIETASGFGISCIKTNIGVNGGDSGGILYYLYSSGATSGSACGILTSGTSSYSYFVKASTVVSNLGCTIY